MKLSQTTRAGEWLKQFDEDDQGAAGALLDSVRFLRGGEVIAGVRRSIEHLLADDPLRNPITLVPVLSGEDMRDSNGLKIHEASLATVFAEFDPSQPLASDPGSEALMAQLIREMRRAAIPGLITPPPITLKVMESEHVRTLVCVTDYIGSGKQVLEYVEAWHRHTTIRSWRSFGLLRIQVVAYAATSAGKRAVEASPHVDGLKIVEIAPGLRDLGNPLLEEKLSEVCRIYAKRAKLWPALGFRDSAGLFASSFSVPNNLPAILIRRSKQWIPFFDGRSTTAALADEIGNQLPETDVGQQLRKSGQVRLAARHEDGDLEGHWQTHLVVLGLIPRARVELAVAVGLTMAGVDEIVASLEHLGLMDEAGRPTPAGLRALKRHRRKPRLISASLVPDPSAYYPRYKR